MPYDVMSNKIAVDILQCALLGAVNIKEVAIGMTGWGPWMNFSKFHAGITTREE